MKRMLIMTIYEQGDIVLVAVLLMLLFPMAAAGAETTNVTIRVNEYIVLENDIYIELIEVGADMGWYARVHFYSYRDSVGETETLYKGDTWPASYTSGSGMTIDVTLDSAFSNAASFVIESSKGLRITERNAGEAEETEAVAFPKLEITRTIDLNKAEIGQTVRVTLTIKNTGSGTATNIMLDEGTITNTYKDGCPSTIDDIAAGETKRLSYDLKIGVDAQIGTREMPPSVLNYKGESGDSYSTESQSSILTITSKEVLLLEPTPTEPITLRPPTPAYLDKYAMVPQTPTIRAGEALNWINIQKSPMTNFVLVSEEGLWEDRTIGYGKKFKYTFDTPGSYTYYCPGYGSSMRGTVTVLEHAELPAPSVRIVGFLPYVVHGSEDLEVKVGWSNIPTNWKLVVSLEKSETDKERLADDVSRIVSGSGEATFKLNTHQISETYNQTKVWACLFDDSDNWASVFTNAGITVIPAQTPITPVQPAPTTPVAIETETPAMRATTPSMAQSITTPKQTAPILPTYLLAAAAVLIVALIFVVASRKKKPPTSPPLEPAPPAPPEPTPAPTPPSAPIPPSDFTPRPTTPSTFPPELVHLYSDPTYAGKGGFARVFKAKRKTDSKTVAVKIPISLDEGTGRSFLREITSWQRLNHENIITLYDANILPIPYLEMEYADSGSLDQMNKPVDVDTASTIVLEIAEGLSYSHAQGVIHRDLKPMNVLLTEDLTPKISDWGLSKIVAESKTSSMYGFSPLYGSPEQISPKKFGKPDERTDIYQLGVIFYELLTGRTPFEGDDLVEVSTAIVTEEPSLPSELNPEAEITDPIILKCLAKKKEDRYQNVRELQNDIASALKTQLKESLRMSVSAQNMKRSAFYCAEICLIHARLGEIEDVMMYLKDIRNYASEEVKIDVAELLEELERRKGMSSEDKISEEFVGRLKDVLHQVRVGR
jgi:hypothetical protein